MEAVAKWPRLSIITKIWSFLRLTRYYYHFVKNFSKISTSLTKLTCKGTNFVWKDECEASFQKLKECLTSTIVLALLSRMEGYIVYYDASRVRLGCMLM